MLTVYHYFMQLLDTACHKLGIKRSELLFGCLFLSLGVAVRTGNYLAGISLSNDEAAMAGNLLAKPFFALFGPLDVGQIAPIGFCLVEWVSIQLLGDNELTLRLIPFAAGVAVLPLAFLFTLRVVGPFCAVLCLAQLAVIPEAIYHANNLKPYSLDLAIAIGLMLLAWGVGSVVCSRKRLLWLAFFGSIAPWFSFSSVFILFGIGAVVMIRYTLSRNWRGLILILGVCFAWIFSFWVQYRFLQSQTRDLYLLNFWDGYFMPFPPFAPGDLGFFSDVLIRVFKNPLWTLGARGSALFFLVGCILIWRRNRPLLALILLPLILNLLISGFHKYPFGERLLLYGVLNLYIPIAVFLEWIWCRKWRFVWLRYAAILLIVLNLAKPTVEAARCLVYPIKVEEMKQVVAYLAHQREPGDTVFVHNHAYITFSYYGKRFNISPVTIRVSRAFTPRTLNKITEDLGSLSGRVWLVFGHGKKIGGTDYETVFLNEAKKRGQLMELSVHKGASTYLFHFPVSELSIDNQ
ncbi:MAG: hypothetical protein GY846_08690 [Deltaproteobacteria bacterium]|nr:hypothetical protein [Deltaproteobacteria bacterium]